MSSKNDNWQIWQGMTRTVSAIKVSQFSVFHGLQQTMTSKSESPKSDTVGSDDLGMSGVSYPAYYGVEAVMGVGRVFHDANSTVGLGEGVFALNSVANTNLSLLLVVACMAIRHTVLEFIMSWGLKRKFVMIQVHYHYIEVSNCVEEEMVYYYTQSFSLYHHVLCANRHKGLHN